MLAWSALGLLSLAAPAPGPTWVLIPAPSPPHCEARAELVARLELTAGLLTTRTSSTGSALEAERGRLGAAFAVEIRPSPEGFEVTLRSDEAPRYGRGATPSGALDRAWPDHAPPLPPPLAAPNPAALRALCAGDGRLAVSTSGPALNPLLLHLSPSFPGARRRGSVFERWGYGLQQLKDGRPEAASRELSLVVRALEKGDWAPVWRRRPGTSTATPSALYLAGSAVHAFGDGSLTRMDARTGAEAWSRHVGRVEPRPVLGGGSAPLVMVGDAGFVGLEPSSGRGLFQLDVPGAHPEMARTGDDVIAAGTDLLLRFSPETGELRWSVGLDRRALAGPVRAGDLLLLPMQVELRVYSLDGQRLRTVALTDELSSPVATTAKGFAWVLSGSDEALQIDPRAAQIRYRQRKLAGADWPPVIVGERLVLQTRARRSEIHFLDASADRGSRRLPGRGPLALRGDFRGFLHLDRSGRSLIGRDASFSRTLRLALPRPALALAVADHRAILGLEDRILEIDAEARALGPAVPVEAPVIEVVMGPGGGAALLASGAIYGWLEPGAAETRTWLRLARRHAARAALRARRPELAEKLARGALARDPRDWPARFLLAASLRNQRSEEALAASVDLLRAVPRTSPEARRLRRILGEGGVKLVREEEAPTPTAGTLRRVTATSTTPLQTPDGVRLGFVPDRRLDFGSTSIWMNERQLAAVREGTLRWRYRLASGDALLRVEAADDRTLLAWSRRSLRRLGVERGRRGARISFSRSPQLGLALGNWTLIWDGLHLRSYSIDPPRALGRAALGGVQSLVALPGEVGARIGREDGSVLEIREGASLSIHSPTRRQGG
ncbi:MAG: PQQ-binding-like beta-propeller repeat protein [Myxococcota bacterium]